jgi:ankyrin repeat protein
MNRTLTGLVATALLVAGCQGRPPAQDETDAGQTRQLPSTPRTTAASPQTMPEPTARPTRGPRRKERASMQPVDHDGLDRRLIAAAWDNDVDRARWLIAKGANVNAKDETEQSAYLVSTSEGYLRLLELTLRNGARVASKDRYNGTGLIRAAERGHADVVGRLLQTRIEVDHVNNLGWTALHEAVILGDGSRRYVDTVRLLVAAGADVDLPSQRDGVRPLRHAQSQGFERVARALRKASRADRLDRDEAAALLLRAARRGHPNAVAVALRAGAPLETRDRNRRSPLLLAAIHDHVAVARLLVALGANPNAQDYRDDSAWLVTGVTGSVPMAETLLPSNPDLGLTNRFGGTSLIPASERGHVDYVRRVVRTDMDLDHVNDLGWTALLEAVILGDGSRPYQRIVRILLDAGADPSIADGDGVTPLEHARRSGYHEIARLLRRA